MSQPEILQSYFVFASNFYAKLKQLVSSWTQKLIFNFVFGQVKKSKQNFWSGTSPKMYERVNFFGINTVFFFCFIPALGTEAGNGSENLPDFLKSSNRVCIFLSNWKVFFGRIQWTIAPSFEVKWFNWAKDVKLKNVT